MSDTNIKLGQRVRDTVTGFEGTVTVVSDHLYGCRRIGITPDATDDGSKREVEFFDEPRLKILDDGIREEWMKKRGELEEETPEAVAPGPSADPTPRPEDSAR